MSLRRCPGVAFVRLRPRLHVRGLSSGRGNERSEGAKWAYDISTRLAAMETTVQSMTSSITALAKGVSHSQGVSDMARTLAALAVFGTVVNFMIPQTLNVTSTGGGGGGGGSGAGGAGGDYGGGGGGGGGVSVRTVVKELDHKALDRRLNEMRAELERALESTVSAKIAQQMTSTLAKQLDQRTQKLHSEAMAAAEKKLAVEKQIADHQSKQFKETAARPR